MIGLANLSFFAQARVLVVNTADNTTTAVGQTNLVQAISLLQDGDTIAFNISGTEPIYLVTPSLTPNNGYPAITNHNVTIDGYTQPGALPNSNPILGSNNAQIKIVLDSRAGGLHREDIPGYGLSEASALLVRGATNVTIRGLSLLGPDFGSYTEDDPASYGVSFADGATQGHVEGCWVGLDPNGTDVFRFAAGVTSFQSSRGEGTTVGVDKSTDSAAVARAQFNLFVGEFIPVILEGNHLRMAGNFFNVFPDGQSDFFADGTPDHLLQAFIEVSSSDNLLIGTDGDGVNDAEERNIFGGVVFAYDSKLIEWYGLTGTNMVIAGNYFGMAVDGVSRFANSMEVFGTVKTGGSLRIGSDFDGVSDALEGNLIAMNYPFGALFPTPAGAAPPVFADMESGAQVSLRGNRLIGNALAPFTYADGSGAQLAAFTSYAAPFVNTNQSIVPLISTNSTQARLRGSCAPGLLPCTNIVVDVYLADEEGWTNGQRFQLAELVYVDPLTLQTDYHGFAQGSSHLGAFVDNGPQDLNPAVGQFEFDISALNLPTNQLVTIAVSYSAAAPGTHNAPALTSDFAFPVTLQMSPTLFIALSAGDVLLSWSTNAGVFNLQATPGLSPSAWTNLSPQPGLLVTGALYQATLPVGSSNAFFRLAR